MFQYFHMIFSHHNAILWSAPVLSSAIHCHSTMLLMFTMNKQFHFSFIWLQGIFPQMKVFVPVYWQTIIQLFVLPSEYQKWLPPLWVASQFMSVQDLFHCRFRGSYQLQQHLRRAFCYCFEVATPFPPHNTFISGTQSLSSSWAVWLQVIVFKFVYNCLNKGRWHLQTSGKSTQRWSSCWGSSLLDLLADFFWFSHGATQGSSVFEDCLKIHPHLCLQFI